MVSTQLPGCVLDERLACGKSCLAIENGNSVDGGNGGDEVSTA